MYFKPKAHGTYAWWLLYIPCEGLRTGHITSKRRVVNASLFVIVVIIVGVQWVILNLAALLHRGIRHCEKHHQLVDAVNNVIS